MVATIIAQQEDATLRAHQARVEPVISFLTLLTVYSVIATSFTFVRSEHLSLFGERLASGEAALLALVTIFVVGTGWSLWRRQGAGVGSQRRFGRRR